jgi:hypothetical protein
MDWKNWRGKRKRRPREHVIAEMGVNFLERQVLRRGHQLRRVAEPEYGTDALMVHFSPESREIENGWVEFQVKSTDQLRVSKDGRSVACTVQLSHVHYWYWELAHPFILVLYDAKKHRAFWIDIQSYLESRAIDDQENLTVHIPLENKLTVASIEHFRNLSLDRTQSAQ